MDRKTLRALVVEYRNKGWTYNKIAKMLEEQYGVLKDRQSLHGVYTRAKSNLLTKGIKYSETEIADVVNLYSLGYNMTEVVKLAETIGTEITYYDARTIVANEAKYIEEAKRAAVFKTVDLLECNIDIKKILLKLYYKGVPVSKKGMKDILNNAYTIIVRGNIANYLADVLKNTEDIELIKGIIKNVGVDIPISDIRYRL